MKIIGHRGAAGLATENTLESIRAAVSAGVDFIEFDVRTTKDHQLVINHDSSLKRVFGVDMTINQHSLDELNEACPNLPTLQQAIKACNDTQIIIELKEVTDPALLKTALKTLPGSSYRFASFMPEALEKIRTVFPDVQMSLLSYRHFFGRVSEASRIGATRIGMHFVMLNHFAVWRARRRNLAVYTYTINSPFIARLYARIFPDITICTNYPDKLQFLRSK